MILQLQPIQISLLWPEILNSAVMANQIMADKREQYGARLLENLLVGKFQAWVCFSMEGEERRTHAIGITTIMDDCMTGARNVHVLSLYGFRTLTEALAVESFNAFRAWAKSNACEGIFAETSNERIKELCALVGLRPKTFSFYGEV